MTTLDVKTDRTLDAKVASEVSRVVDEALRHANARHNTYSWIELNALIKAYQPQNIHKLFLPPVVSVLAYEGEDRNRKLVGTGFLGHGKYPEFTKNGVDAFLYGMYVDPSHQGQGIASQIFQKIKERAKLAGIQTIQAFPTKFPRVKEMYEKWGFRDMGEVVITPSGIPMRYRNLELQLK